MSGRRVAILGLDNFSRKNRAQLTGLNARGYSFDVFTSDSLGSSAANLPPGNTLSVLHPGAAGRVRQLASYLARNRAGLNHVEVYPGGRFAAVYLLLARRFGIPAITVERGDLLYQDRYGALTRRSMGLAYRWADVVWCREFYQERALREMGVKRTFFLANAVEIPREVPGPAERSVDFAWINRLIPERKAEWVVDAASTPGLAGVSTVMVGALPPGSADAATLAQQEYVEAHRPAGMRLEPYGDPFPLLSSARFFLLPADIVYCNNALLEAMAHGVVPLVSDVEGARLIVEDGVSGIVFPHTPEGLRAAMERAAALSPGEHAALSRGAVERVRTHFSIDRWCDTLEEEYRRVGR